jgi:hypothetical protein
VRPGLYGLHPALGDGSGFGGRLILPGGIELQPIVGRAPGG